MSRLVSARRRCALRIRYCRERATPAPPRGISTVVTGTNQCRTYCLIPWRAVAASSTRRRARQASACTPPTLTTLRGGDGTRKSGKLRCFHLPPLVLHGEPARTTLVLSQSLPKDCRQWYSMSAPQTQPAINRLRPLCVVSRLSLIGQERILECSARSHVDVYDAPATSDPALGLRRTGPRPEDRTRAWRRNRAGWR